MQEPTIGRIERVQLREVWPHEALDFTRWLGDNLDVLSEELGIELTDAETEGCAGDFRVDIVAKDSANRTVIIENQLERSNHDHLGKLLTYFAMMGADVAIWVVSEARPEHVSAVSWLNENSSADFYLVQVEAVRIGASSPAPLLRGIVGPSPETRAVRDDKREMSETQRLLKEFWTGLLQRASERGIGLHATVSPQPQNWIATGAGVSGVIFSYVMARDWSQVELYIDRGRDQEDTNKRIFDQLHAVQREIEERFGRPLEWQRLDAKRACRIRYRMEGGGYRTAQDRWPEIQDAMIDAMVRFEAALRPHINALDI